MIIKALRKSISALMICALTVSAWVPGSVGLESRMEIVQTDFAELSENLSPEELASRNPASADLSLKPSSLEERFLASHSKPSYTATVLKKDFINDGDVPMAGLVDLGGGDVREASEADIELAKSFEESFTADNEVHSLATIDNLCFTLGAKTVENGEQIDYDMTSTDTPVITLTKKEGTEVVSGSSYQWLCDDTNVISIKEVVDQGFSGVRLNILSPGYAGLYCYVKDASGNVYANPYCVIHVELAWEKNSVRYDVMSSSNAYGYGLGEAFTTARDYTLQLYTDDSKEGEDYSHYLRRLNGITYTSMDGTMVKGDIERTNLKEMSMAVEWSVSNRDVLEIDPLTGFITAKSAGFAVVTASTTTKNLNTGKADEISMDVIVVPEAIVVGHTNTLEREFAVNASSTDNQIVVQSNAVYADTLSWALFRDATLKEDLTKKYKDNIEISSVTGRVVLTGLPAGTYVLTAIPIRGTGTTYSIKNNTYAKSLRITIVVPLTFPDSPIIMNYYSKTMADSYDIFENSNLPEGGFRFTSADPEVASVGVSDGVIEAESEGETQIRITALDGILGQIYGTYTASGSAMGFVTDSDGTRTENGLKVEYNPRTGAATFIIDVIVINGISISANSVTLAMGATYQLYLTSPSPFDGVITWSSSDSKIATVDENGLVTAVAAGTTRVSATIKVGGVKKRARCTVKVITAVSKIELNAKKNYVEVGDNLTISANITPKVNGAELIWSCSDESKAAIADASALSMTITGVSPGTVIITAVNQENAIVGSISIDVVDEIKGITLSDTEVTIPVSAGYYQLYATVNPELPEGQKITWNTSDKKVLTVTENGKVELKKSGTAVVSVVTPNGLMAQCTFTVTEGISAINLDKTQIDLAVGESYRITYTIKPESASKTTLKWSSTNTKIATVDATGYLTAKNIGECVITAQATDGSGVFVMCTVTVTQAATSIKLDVTSLILNVNETYVLETILTPANCTDEVTFESSDTKVAQVNKKGKITAKAKGNCIILAKTSMGLTVYCNVTVTQQVTGITISTSKETINVGDKLELEATIQPANATDAEVEWSSDDNKIATVDAKGRVTGVAPGTTLIKCVSVDGGYMDYCVLTVVDLITDIIFDPDYVEVGVGKKLTLSVLVDGQVAANKDLDWSSANPNICKVDKKGVITGVKLGSTIITATARDGSESTGECEVKVIRATESLETDPSFMMLVEGEKGKITFSITPKKATYKEPLFASDDESIAVVDKKGNVTALKAGSCIVTATAKDNPSLTAKTIVKVIAPVNATSVTFAESEIIMVPGESKTVPYSIVPSNFTESFTWSSDNPVVATVDETSGRITARSVGASTITLMTKSGKKATVRVYVVGLSRENITLHQYESLLVKLEIDGAGSENLTVRWDTDNQTIAEVTRGNVTGKALGTTKVYAIVNGRKLACTVKVVKNINR